VLPSLEAVVGEVGPQLPACGGTESTSPPLPGHMAGWLCLAGSGAPAAAGPCVWDSRHLQAPGPRQVSLASGQTGKWESGPWGPSPLSEDPWSPRANPLTLLRFSFPVRKAGTVNLTYLTGGVRLPASLCKVLQAPGAKGTLNAKCW